MAKCLITGITGMVGSHFADYLSTEHLADYLSTEHPEVELCGLKRWRSPQDNTGVLERSC